MTTTAKLNPTELLSQLAESDSSGYLEVVAEAMSWKIYFQQGKFKYIESSVQILDQLKYHLYQLGWTSVAVALKQMPASTIADKSSDRDLYSKVISWFLAEKHFDLTQAATLVEEIIKDELQYCLMLDRGNSFWHDEASLPAGIIPQLAGLVALDVPESLNEQRIRLKLWQNCSDRLLSVHQRPYFAPSWSQKPLPPGSLNLQSLTELTKVLKGRTSIRQLSMLLKKDELQVAQILSPYIEEKIIYLHHAPAPLNKLPNIPRDPKEEQSQLDRARQVLNNTAGTASTKTWKIVCIDDSPTILNEIKRFLSQEKYEITAIDDPVQAVSQIFKINPDLILLDITMPRINGYKLCSLLRNSGKCDDIPIIMVTGNKGLIDKARSKLSGATDYFTKPFTQKGLNEIVEKYLQ